MHVACSKPQGNWPGSPSLSAEPSSSIRRVCRQPRASLPGSQRKLAARATVSTVLGTRDPGARCRREGRQPRSSGRRPSLDTEPLLLLRGLRALPSNKWTGRQAASLPACVFPPQTRRTRGGTASRLRQSSLQPDGLGLTSESASYQSGKLGQATELPCTSVFSSVKWG